jgi:mRNA interferase MazF
VIQRGEIWWADLGDPSGSGPAGNRPVLVVQADAFNRSRLGTVIVAVVTSNLALAEAPGNVLLRQEETGLPRDSVVNVSQLVTLDKRALAERAGVLSFGLQQHVDDGVRLALGL